MPSIIPDLIEFCHKEWRFYGGAEINLNGTVKDGLMEYQDGPWQRIAEYWQHIGGPYKNLTGKDRGTPWSAAFISFCFKETGAGINFPYSAGHATYINQAIRNHDNQVTEAPIIGHELKGYSLKPGDLIGYWRGNKRITFENARKIGWYQSHTDIVVEVHNNYAYIIGGNVMYTVTRRQVRTNSNSELTDRSQNWFVVIQNNM